MDIIPFRPNGKITMCLTHEELGNLVHMVHKFDTFCDDDYSKLKTEIIDAWIHCVRRNRHSEAHNATPPGGPTKLT